MKAKNLEPSILVIFGATGDLTRRKLYPALYNLYQEGLLPDEFAVVSVGRREKTKKQLQEDIITSINEFSRTRFNSDTEDRQFLDLFHYFRLDFQESEGFYDLKVELEEIDEKYHTLGNRVFFLAVAPEFFGEIADKIQLHGMASNEGSWQRVVIENLLAEI